MEHKIDCGENTNATCHPPEYVTALHRGQHVNYDLEPGQDMVWLCPAHEPMVEPPVVEGQWRVPAYEFMMEPLVPEPKVRRGYPAHVFMADLPLPEVRWGVSEPSVTNFAWIRCLRAISAAWDLVAGGWQQHLTAHRGDTLFLPLPVCQWLLANRPTDWQQMTVVPGTLDAGLHTDAGTGLDYLPAVTTGAWGRDSLGSYFTLDGDMGKDERATLTVDDSGVVFMDQ